MTARDWFGLTCAVLRWWPCAVVSVCMSLVAWVLSPALAALSFSTDDGNLPRWCYWFQTHDNHLDALWKGTEGAIHRTYDANDFKWLFKYTNDEIEASTWLKFCARAAWIRRNPAYGFANLFGFDKTGVVTVYELNRGNINSGFWHYFLIVRNDAGRYAWQWRGFYPWAFGRALRVQLGWKIQLDGMLATHVNPFRKDN